MTPSDRPVALRLAHLHLRMGSLALARAELELIEGSGALDAPALVDLAEARWRTGDLVRAGEAADMALERGVDDPLALVIAAEAAAAKGHHAEADGLAGRALESLGTTLDALFAGMPRSPVWPGDPEQGTVPAEALDAGAGDTGAPATSVAEEAAEALAGGRTALAESDLAGAALGLSIAIRLDPRLAEDVLAAIGDRASVPLLALVTGDALRLLGRDQEALDAYDRARGRPAPHDGTESG